MKIVFSPFSILKFVCFLLVFSSCDQIIERENEINKDSVAVNIEEKKLELRQKELELKEQELKFKEEAMLKERQKQEAIEIAKNQVKFERATDCVVISKKAYFYSSPDLNTQMRSFLVNGDRCSPLKIRNNFIYVDFYNPNRDKTTSGWISMDDLEVVY